ncbi:Transposase, IS605 OrfB [Crocosphaera watsonii WH 0401]|uniref:Transposase, IS605 OrfB n=1 Tax=Crocosphaera watsonii WH 0401 TaxID=555881 RepID=T2JB79_CROWT|nr:Transposase, IS605 OrfB [Crocosphaera watsonii WH 0401]
MGIKTLATLSTGKVFEGAYSYRKLSGKLAKLQRELNRKASVRLTTKKLN